jgi:sarcosine oxidase
MARTSDVGVIGAGIVGLSTAYALKAMGASVSVYERGRPGGDQSAGESRIFRHAHDDPRLVAFARDSRAAWTEWEERFGVELVSGDGTIAIGPKVERRLRVLEQVGGIAARSIDARELAERMPLLAGYDGPAMLDEGGGAIRTRAAIEALAGELGGAFVLGDVIAVRRTAGQVTEVRAAGVRGEHQSVVVCAGRGTGQLARGAGLSLPVRLAAHVRLTFAVRAEPPARLPCFQDGSGEFGEVGIYATAQPGNGRYALGVSGTTEAQEDGSLIDPAALASLDERARRYVSRALPGLDPEPVELVHCWVTDLPWSEDGVAVWESPGMLFVAGHNLFKQAPGLGNALARAALGQGLADELRPEARLGAPR